MKNLHFKDVTGTNDMAKSLVKAGETEIIVTADFQSKGRGKLGSQWYGEREKDLFLSFTLPVFRSDDLEKYAVISCVGVRKVLKKYGFDTDIKAPNDIYIKGKKLCGILCEAEFFDKKPYMIVGVGINVFSHEFPDWLNATSLCLEKENFKCDLKKLGNDIADETVNAFHQNYEKVFEEYNLYLIKEK